MWAAGSHAEQEEEEEVEVEEGRRGETVSGGTRRL